MTFYKGGYENQLKLIYILGQSVIYFRLVIYTRQYFAIYIYIYICFQLWPAHSKVGSAGKYGRY